MYMNMGSKQTILTIVTPRTLSCYMLRVAACDTDLGYNIDLSIRTYSVEPTHVNMAARYSNNTLSLLKAFCFMGKKGKLN